MVCVLTLLAPLVLQAQDDVTWHSLGTNENDSMPLGNGDVALNVWTEQNGDIVLLVAKADAWSENGQLMKLGRVRVKLTPNPFAGAADFTQTLRMEAGEVALKAGNNSARIWVDANHPVARVEVETEQPVEISAQPEVWRTTTYHLDQKAVSRGGFFEWGNNPEGITFHPDVMAPADSGLVAVYHYNTNSIYPLVFEREHLESLLEKYPDPLLHRCFGLAIGKGEKGPARVTRVDVLALTETNTTPEEWLTAMKGLAASVEGEDVEGARAEHELWWTDFWSRSRLHVAGDADAEKISQGYAIQRFMTACAGRGAQPIKFNGSLFTVGHDLAAGKSSDEGNHDPDFRQWGNSYWNQNNRHMYWPLIASGDDDELQPWFDMYMKGLPLATDRTQLYFHHGGAAFIETEYFWGLPNVNDFGWKNAGPELESSWMRYHIQGGLEVLAQMLDEYAVTEDKDFARTDIVPLAEGLVKYYDEHWPRGADGKIRMSPSQAIETYQEDAVNPTPDVAGLKSVLPSLLALPSGVASATQRASWSKTLKDLPPLPMGTTAHGKVPPRGKGEPNGKRVILPAEVYGDQRNHENPELYAVFPYPLYEVGKPDLEMARDTFRARANPFGKCWGQDGIHAAYLGLTEDARKSAVEEFTSYGGQRFKWFWSRNSDWIPDMDNGGAGMMTLQSMLMQCDGKRIMLLPAWPANWTADFKLHAPYKTIVEGRVENGKVKKLKVTPKAREKDVMLWDETAGKFMGLKAQ
jgi:hypothetical protein